MNAAITQQKYTYPPAPIGASEDIISPGKTFKAQIAKVTAAILLFIISYLVIFLLAIAFAVASSYLGITIIVRLPQLITLMLGAGFIGLGLMVVYFLLKFLFKRNKIDLSGFIEITAEDEPELFNFVKKVSGETHCHFPKRIYISDDVNASVFYDSSFLSMFFPIKKNLRIGLGLVNVVNLSEFKAILAHEFGHFSQRSMKFGSYVYYVNNVIYNMLYDNEGYDNILQRWARMSQYFRLFALLTIRIVNGIQYLLRQIYIVVNRSYSSLSIEMEYHADSVSAFVAGSDHIITSLKKIEIGQICYANVLAHCNGVIAQNLKADNFYPKQEVLIRQFAADFNIPLHNGALQISTDTETLLNPSRIEIKNQWASHPSIADRDAKAQALNIKTPVIDKPAWILFKDANELQQRMTSKVYELVSFKQQPQTLDTQSFTDSYFRNVDDNNFNKEYKGYYNSRIIKRFDTAQLNKEQQADIFFDDVFSDEHCKLPGKINSLNKDIETLAYVSQEINKIKTFDFDGAKYSYRDAEKIKQKLKNEVTLAETELYELDKRAYRFFYNKAADADKKQQLVTMYNNMFDCDETTQKDIELFNTTMAAMQPVYTQQKFADIRLTMQDVALAETKVIPRLEQILEEGSGFNLNEHQQKNLRNYLNHNRIYFMKPSFDDHAIGIFNNAMNTFVSAAIDKSFRIKKQLLNQQLK